MLMSQGIVPDTQRITACLTAAMYTELRGKWAAEK